MQLIPKRERRGLVGWEALGLWDHRFLQVDRVRIELNCWTSSWCLRIARVWGKKSRFRVDPTILMAVHKMGCFVTELFL